MQSPIRNFLLVSTVAFGLSACSKENAEAPAAATESAPAVAEQPAASGRGKICDQLKSTVAETIAIQVSAVKVMDDEGLPLRCIYNPEDAGATWFEIADGVTLADLEESRKRYDSGGSETAPAPDLGPGGFTTTFSFMKWAIGVKDGKQISVVSNKDFATVQTLWKKVAEAI